MRSDDAAFAQRLFADPVMLRTLPLALRGGELEISREAVRVSSPAVDGVAAHAVAAAKALAMAVVCSLGLPGPRAEG